jgi:hypothetical protein
MLPPWSKGVSAEIASSSGAVPMVPMKGRHGNRSRLLWVSHPSRSSYSQTRSGTESCSVRVNLVEVSPPKNGMNALTAQSRVASISRMCTASVSPGSAPTTRIGPVCGLRYAPRICDGRSSARVIRLSNASSV